MGVTGISFTMYPVANMVRAVAFYRDVLGLSQSGVDQEHWVEFDVGGGTFGVGDFEQVGKPGSAQSLALEVQDMADFRSKLSNHGVESTEPYETPVCWISMLRDPDGNQVWLHQSKPR
ncbi:MAG: VOC family protein [Vulcanimicrobiaceae bacterium]